MDFVDRVSAALGGGATRPGVSYDSLLKFTDLSPRVQQHLVQVYLTLAAMVGVAAVGTVVNMWTGLGGWLAIIGFMVCVPWLLSVPTTPATLQKRRALLAGAAFSQGALLGPLVGLAANLHPGVLITALAGTCLVFGCFSAAALMAKRRSYLFLGALLSSAMSTLALMRLATWVFGGRALLFEAELYGGLLLFSGYVLFDTQMIVERAEGGDTDVLRHALDLFVDFAALFVRLLVILLRNAEQRREREGGSGSSARDKRRRR